MFIGRKKLSVQYPVYLEENISAPVPEVGCFMYGNNKNSSR